MDTVDHPVVSRLPKPSTRPAIVGDPGEFRGLIKPEGGLVKLEEYLKTEIPQPGLHIVSFIDMTTFSNIGYILSWML